MTGFTSNIDLAKQYYADLNFDTIPLLLGSKQAEVANWQNQSSFSLWQGVNADCNLAIRCGGKAKLAVIDCDEKEKPGTFDNVQRYLEGLGYLPSDYTVVQTASVIGKHIYITLTESFDGSFTNLSPEFGAGEFRYGKGAYVVAPPSVVVNPYSLISGDFRHLPKLKTNEIEGIANLVEKKERIENGPISRFGWRLLRGDVNSIKRYRSRSEADQALLSSLVNTGFEFDDIFRLFKSNPTSGKFHELQSRNPRNAATYLRTSFYKAKQWTSTNISNGRKRAYQARHWANTNRWSGRTGVTDNAVFLAHVEIAERCGKLSYGASCRELAELANTSHMTAAKATKRLRAQGFLQLEVKAVATYSNIYRLTKYSVGSSSVISSESKAVFTHDVFCYHGLGKSGAVIWAALKEASMTVKELIEITGKTRPTIKKRLDIMQNGIVDFRTGAIIAMVTEREGRWHAMEEIDLDYIAELLNVCGVGDERKRRHDVQREMRGLGLELLGRDMHKRVMI